MTERKGEDRLRRLIGAEVPAEELARLARVDALLRMIVRLDRRAAPTKRRIG
jgi:hypothetical protein